MESTMQLNALIAIASFCFPDKFSFNMKNARTVVKTGQIRYAREVAFTLTRFITKINKNQFRASKAALARLIRRIFRFSFWVKLLKIRMFCRVIFRRTTKLKNKMKTDAKLIR